MALLLRSLLADRARLVLSVLAVAAAVALVLLLEGFKVGVWRQAAAYPEHLGSDLIIVQAGVRNLTGARSALPVETLDQVGRVEQVAAVHPLVVMAMVFDRDGVKTPVALVGYHDKGGPWRLREGRAVRGPGETVLDVTFARTYGFGIGDRLEVLGKPLTVVGISEGASAMFTSFLFVTVDEALAFMSSASAAHPDAAQGSLPDAAQGSLPGAAQGSLPGADQDRLTSGALSFVLADLDAGADPSAVREQIERSMPGVDTLTPHVLAANDVAMAKDLLGSVVSLLVVIAYVVGVLVIGLTLYASVFERLREYGIAKALGARNGLLYRFVIIQAVLFALAGVAVGLLVSAAVATAIPVVAPQYLVVPTASEPVIRTTAAALLMSVIAALIPIRQVAEVDPAMVFRA